VFGIGGDLHPHEEQDGGSHDGPEEAVNAPRRVMMSTSAEAGQNRMSGKTLWLKIPKSAPAMAAKTPEIMKATSWKSFTWIR